MRPVSQTTSRPVRKLWHATNMIEAEGLTKRYGETQALAGVDFAVPAGTDPRACSGPTGPARRRPCASSPPWPSPTRVGPRWPAIDVVAQAAEVRRHIGVAAQDATLDELLTGRQNLVMVGELSRHGPARRPGPGRRAARPVRADRRRRPGHEGLLGRHAPPARPGGQPDDPAPGAVPRRADDRARPHQPPAGVGRHPGAGRPTASRCCSPPSTSTRPTRWPTGSSSIDHGRVIAEGTPRELKEASRSARLEVTLAVPHARGRRRPAAPLVDGRVHVSDDGRRLERRGRQRARAWPPRGAGPRRGRRAGRQHRGAPALARRRVLLPHRPHGRRIDADPDAADGPPARSKEPPHDDHRCRRPTVAAAPTGRPTAGIGGRLARRRGR